MNAHLNYFKILISLTIFLLFTVASFNWLIDPFGIYQSIKIHRINTIKTQQEIIGKFTIKALCALEQDYNIFIMGSSRANRGIDPTYSALTAWGKAYNVSLAGAHLHELKQVFDFILQKQPNVQIIVFSLDFLMFTDRTAPNPNFDQSPFGTKNYLLQHVKNTFSLDESYYAIKTLYDNYYADVSVPIEPSCDRQGAPKPNMIKPYPHHEQFIKTLTGFFEAPQLYAGYCYSETKLLELQQIIEKAHERGILVKFFISPIHAWQLEAIRLTGLYPLFEQWKRDLVDILAQDRLKHSQQAIYELYDFSGYYPMSMEAVPQQIQQPMQWFWESSHYKTQLGNLVLDKLFNQQTRKLPADFGILVDKNNIETHLANIRQAQMQYQQTHLDDINEITALIKTKFHKIPTPCPH